MAKRFSGVVNVDITQSVPDWAPYTQPIALAEVPESVAPNIRNRSYTVAVEVDIDADEASGVSGEPFVDLAAEARMALLRD